MTIVLDAGGLLAIERGDRDVIAELKRALLRDETPRTHGGVLAQVWRGGKRRQAALFRALPSIEVVPLDRALGERAGVLLGRARGADAIDAAVILIAMDGDLVLTSDPDDLRALAETAAVHVELIRT